MPGGREPAGHPSSQPGVTMRIEEFGAAVYELSESATLVRTARGELLHVGVPSVTVLDSLAGSGSSPWAEADDLQGRLLRSAVRRPSTSRWRVFGGGRPAVAPAPGLASPNA